MGVNQSSFYLYCIGMLWKSKGQILRIAAAMHVLFHWKKPLDILKEISSEALKASITFVDVCVQHAAFLAGRGDVQEAIDNMHQTQLGNRVLW